jgi:hypothetical protein
MYIIIYRRRRISWSADQLSASQTGLTERCGRVGCNYALDAEGTGFKYRPMDGLS